MAKPTQIVEWAENTNYASGPFTGAPTKLFDPVGKNDGSIPGEGICAEFYNYNIYTLGLWSQWALAGTFDPDLDAHIVETDGGGIARIASLEVGDTASIEVPLKVTANSGGALSTVEVENLIGGLGISAVCVSQTAISGQNAGDSFSPTVLGINTSTGPGVNGSSSIGTGVRGNTESGIAGRFQASTTGVGLDVDSTSGIGIDVNTTSGIAVDADNSGLITIAATTTNINGAAFFGTIDNNGSSTNSSAVLGTNTGSGVGLNGQSISGYGGYLRNVDGTRAPLRLEPSATTPSSLQKGDIWVDSGNLNLGFSQGPGVKKYAWSTTRGFAAGFNSSLGGLLVPLDLGLGFVPGVSMTLNAANFEAPTDSSNPGFVEIDFSFQARGSIGVLVSTLVQVVDVTAGVVAESFAVAYNGATLDLGLTQVNLSFRYLCPAVGSRVFRLEFQSSAAQDYSVFNQVLRARGMFPTAGG